MKRIAVYFVLLVLTLAVGWLREQEPAAESDPRGADADSVGEWIAGRKNWRQSLESRATGPFPVEAIAPKDVQGVDEVEVDASAGSELFEARQWAESDPERAGAWALKAAQDQVVSATVLEQVALGLAERNHSFAIDWWAALPSSADKESLAIQIGYEAARHDPQAALNLVAALPESAARDDSLDHAVRQWAAIDMGGAVEWAEGIEDSTLRQRMISAAAVAGAETHPTAAATLLTERVEPGNRQQRAALAIVQRWAQHSPEDAVSWVAGFPDVPVRSEALRFSLRAWNIQSAPAASGWASALPPGPFRDSVLELQSFR